MSRLDRLLRVMGGTSVVPETVPFRIDPPGAAEAVLLLHGLTGVPRELSQLGASLAEAGYAVFAPRYPGHGTNRADFLATGAVDWLRRGFDSYLDLASEYGTVHLLGHSMGGLVATIIAAASYSPRLVLLCPAFKLANRAAVLSPLVGAFAPVLRRRRQLSDSERDPMRRKLFADYWSDDFPAAVAQLGALRRAALKVLPRLGARVLLIAGGADPVVPPSVAHFVERRCKAAASFESRVIPGAGHLLPFDAQAEETCAIVRGWMAKA